jgi:hypothetical protein
METYGRFLYEFLGQFFSGIITFITGLVNGLIEGAKLTFNIPAYQEVILHYSSDFSISEWALVVVAIVALVIIVGIAVLLIAILIKKILKLVKKVKNQDALLEEVATLNKQIEELVEEKSKILSLANPELGVNTSALESDEVPENVGVDGKAEESINPELESRFSKLTFVDQEYANYKVKDYGNSFTLPEFCDLFRNFAASQLHLFYSEAMVRTFISGIASTKLVILQGISGTGKTSLAYAWGKFVKHDSCVASVQPSWRDRTDLFGYLNEFTKRFNETDFLQYLYTAGYTDEIYTVILDEMNLARVEYYFAEMLSILEMHNTDEWQIEIVSSSTPTDPKKLMRGKLKIPENTWYIGTINNDDSTFMVTDKVYDRAMPIDINEKGTPFEARNVPAQDINFSYVNMLFNQAFKEYAMSDEMLEKIEVMDNYVIKNFRVAFGNRIVKHMKKFVPVFVACGGEEVAGVDYFVAKKILRKFESLNLALIRDKIDGYVDFLNKTFGENKMVECIDVLLRLKKME